MKRIISLLVIFSSVCAWGQSSSESPSTAVRPTHDTYLKLAAEVDEALNRDVLNMWFPRAVDREHGGFHSHFTREWKWAESEGKITPEFGDGKNLYGIGFCIYGAAAAYEATGDEKALALAKEGFLWTDKHAHDAVHGGYFETLQRDGTPVAPSAENGKVQTGPIGPVNYKSMNTHIHLLEAFTELYRVWPDATLRARVEELLVMVRDKICVEPGVMNLYFTNEWKAIPDH